MGLFNVHLDKANIHSFIQFILCTFLEGLLCPRHWGNGAEDNGVSHAHGTYSLTGITIIMSNIEDRILRAHVTRYPAGSDG